MSETRDFTPENATQPIQNGTPDSSWLVEGVDFLPANSYKTPAEQQARAEELAMRVKPQSIAYDKGDWLG